MNGKASAVAQPRCNLHRPKTMSAIILPSDVLDNPLEEIGQNKKKRRNKTRGGYKTKISVKTERELHAGWDGKWSDQCDAPNRQIGAFVRVLMTGTDLPCSTTAGMLSPRSTPGTAKIGREPELCKQPRSEFMIRAQISV